MAIVLVTAAVPLVIAGLGLMAWMVKTLLTTASTLESVNGQIDDMERRNNERFQRLEGVVFTAAWRRE